MASSTNDIETNNGYERVIHEITADSIAVTSDDDEEEKAIDRAQMCTMIEQVREQILLDFESNPDRYDASDIELVKCDDWQVERFILRKKTIPGSVEMMKGTLRWRHQLRMPQMQDSDYPEEFFKIGSMFGFEKDRAGNGVVYFRVRLHKKIKEIEPFVQSYMMHIVNKVDMSVNGKGLLVVFDCSRAGLANLDMEIVWFLVDSLIKYYPYGLKRILVHEMPWILSSAWMLVKGWMPEEFRNKIVFISKKSITDYISLENLPYFLGGTCKKNYHEIPRGCRPAVEYAPERGLSDREVKKILKIFRPFLDEADDEIKAINALL